MKYHSLRVEAQDTAALLPDRQAVDKTPDARMTTIFQN